MKKHAVIVVGLETIKNKDGSLKCWADTFLDNANTWKHDHHEKYETKILDTRDYMDLDDPLAAIWEELQKENIDLLFYSGHSDETTLYVVSKYRVELESYQRFIDCATDWSEIEFNPHAEIYLSGCQAGGKEGKKFDQCIAQDIADKTEAKVFAYASKSSQHKKGDGYYQIPDIGGFVLFTKSN